MYKFKFADVGEGIHEAVVFEWYVKEGDEVGEGEKIFSVETDKFTTDVTSPVPGKIAKIYNGPGAEVTVGDLMVDIDDGSEGGEEEPAAEEKKGGAGPAVVGAIVSSDDIIEEYTGTSTPKASPVQQSAPAPVAAPAGVVNEAPAGNVALATPVARNFAKVMGIDINRVVGTGNLGRVTKEDIQMYVDGKSAPAPAAQAPATASAAPVASSVVNEAAVERIPMSKMRETISKNMVKSKFTIPHTTTMFEFDVTELWDLRKEVNTSLSAEGIKLSFMPFIVKALVAALKKHPIMNSELDEANREIILKKYYNIGIAVDTSHGLSVPIIRDADKKSMIEIHEDIKRLAEQAEAKTLPMDSMTGGTFTITNYGSVGGLFGTPVINHPESGILGVGAIYKKPMYDENDRIVPRYVLPVSMSFDHRTIDGADANRFAIEFGKILASRTNILLN